MKTFKKMSVELFSAHSEWFICHLKMAREVILSELVLDLWFYCPISFAQSVQLFLNHIP